MAKPPDIRPAPVAELLPGEDLALLGGQEAVEQKAHLSPMGQAHGYPQGGASCSVMR
jgi:hypothetical protein